MTYPSDPPSPSRRQLLRSGAAGTALAWVTLTLRPAQALAADASPEAAAQRAALDATVRAWTGGAVPRSGRVEIDIAPLVENGNAVPITVSVPSPMTTADHVTSIALFNERNPQREVAVFHFTPESGRAQVATRIRLATSQTLVAVARTSDGSLWSKEVEVLVTLAACVEGG